MGEAELKAMREKILEEVGNAFRIPPSVVGGTTVRKPRWYRPTAGNRISWEIYSRRHYFITINLGRHEFQINRWP